MLAQSPRAQYRAHVSVPMGGEGVGEFAALQSSVIGSGLQEQDMEDMQPKLL